MAKKYNETRVSLKFVSTNDKGEDTSSVKVLTEKQANEEIEDAKKAGKPEPEVVKMQTFAYNEAESLSDIQELVPNEVEAVNVFNRGYVLKQQSIIRDFMLDDEQAAQDGVYDLLGDAAEVRERRKATPTEKAMKALSQLTPDQIAAILQQFQAASAA